MTDIFHFNLYQRAVQAGFTADAIGTHTGGQVGRVDEIAVNHGHESLNEIFKFAHISRPKVPPENFQGTVRIMRGPASHFLSVFGAEITHQRQDILMAHP